MELNEILLLVAFVIILLASTRFRKIQTPFMNYARLLAGILMITMIWFFGNSPIAVRVVLTVVFASTMIGAIISLRKQKKNYNKALPSIL